MKVLVIAFGALITAGPAASAQSIKIEGAAAGHAINKTAAERFQKARGGAARIALGISGDMGGMSKFCSGRIDVVNTSRPIQKPELEACAKSYVEFVELPIAFDAVTVIVNPQNRFVESLSLEDLRKLWESAAQGRIRKWNQVNTRWPDAPVKLLGPDRLSDESRYFGEAVLGPSRPQREDYMATTEDSIIVQGVARDPNALGYVPLTYYLANRGQVRAVPIQGLSASPIAPTVEAVAKGLYQPLSRPLFLYVNLKSLERPAVREFVEFYLTNGARLAKESNYVPLAAATYELNLTHLKKRARGTVWNGDVPVGLTLEALHRKQATL